MLEAAAPPPEAMVDEACVVTFAVKTHCPVVHYKVDFLDPDGERRARVQAVTDEGMSAATELKVQIRQFYCGCARPSLGEEEG